ncbi:MAG: ABC transporter ATP-binding protein [Blautia sp.]|nr:ABC transporter ATP-binding protein [Blautia sp.]
MQNELLKVVNLGIEIEGEELVHDISFQIENYKITCIVGESGSGKSLTMSAVLGLLPRIAHKKTDSKIEFLGDSMFCIYQDPMNSFNYSVKVGKQLYQMAKGYRKLSRDEFNKEMCEILDRIRIGNPIHTLDKYPFELSGGMLQRLMIACAILIKPSLIIADEPTTALDVSVQKEIMREFRAINKEYDVAIIVVTHDFGVVAELANNVIVMHNGCVVEEGSVFEVFDSPKQNYTKELLEASFREAEV